MKTIRFILQKIVIVEVMLLLLFFAKELFQVSIPVVDVIISTGLKILTPIAGISLVLYIILSIFSFQFIEFVFEVIVLGVILYYLFRYLL